MSVDLRDLTIVVASDVRGRDGIGVEVYVSDELVMEVFRNDATKSRTVMFYSSDLPLEIVERSIARFTKEIPWDFVDGEDAG